MAASVANPSEPRACTVAGAHGAGEGPELGREAGGLGVHPARQDLECG